MTSVTFLYGIMTGDFYSHVRQYILIFVYHREFRSSLSIPEFIGNFRVQMNRYIYSMQRQSDLSVVDKVFGNKVAEDTIEL